MKLFFAQPLPSTPLRLLQSAGYHPFTDPQTGESSFVRHLGPLYYPRFHVYVTEESTRVIFDLHLDQKQPSYRSSHAHSAEYEGSTVEYELQRMRQAMYHACDGRLSSAY